MLETLHRDLHKLAKIKFKPHKIKTTIIFVIFALVILLFLPNHTIDPWDLFNPRNFGILIVTIAAIQFGGYLAIQLFGERFGIALTGLMGGFISSTAVFANLSHTLHAHPKFKLAIIASSILATVAMLIEIMTIMFVASPELLLFIFKPMLVMLAVSIIFVISLLHMQKFKMQTRISTPKPLNILSVFRTALFIAFTLVVIAIVKRFVGTEGVLLISFLGGLFEIHGISLATALLYLDHHLTMIAACEVLYVAILASFVSKFFLLWSLTPKRFALETSLFLLGILASGGLTYWLIY